MGYAIPITHYPLPITQKSGFPPQVRESLSLMVIPANEFEALAELNE
jgi:hypothetical protein